MTEHPSLITAEKEEKRETGTMFLVATAQKNILVSLLRKTGFEVHTTKFSDLIICRNVPPETFLHSGYIKRVTPITEKMAMNFIEMPESHPKSGDLVYLRNDTQEFIGTVHGIKDHEATVMIKVFGQPRIIRVGLDEITTHTS